MTVLILEWIRHGFFFWPSNLLESVRAERARLDAGGARALALVHGHVGLTCPDEDRVLIVFVWKNDALMIKLTSFLKFSFHALPLRWPMDAGAITLFFILLGNASSSNFIRNGCISILLPFTWEERKHLDVGGIISGWASITTRCFIQLTIAYWA